jgi:hypothetical protein
VKPNPNTVNGNCQQLLGRLLVVKLDKVSQLLEHGAQALATFCEFLDIIS